MRALPTNIMFYYFWLRHCHVKKAYRLLSPVQKIEPLQHGQKMSEQHKRNNDFKETAFLKTKIIKMKLQNTFFIKKERN